MGTQVRFPRPLHYCHKDCHTAEGGTWILLARIAVELERSTRLAACTLCRQRAVASSGRVTGKQEPGRNGGPWGSSSCLQTNWTECVVALPGVEHDTSS